MGTRSTSVASFLVLACLQGLGAIPVSAQTASQTPAASAHEELVVDGKEAAFIGSEPAALLPPSDIPDDIGRPSAEDISNLIPEAPGNEPSISLPDVDNDIGDLIIPPATGSPVPAQASSTRPPWPFEKMEGMEPLLISDAEIVSMASDAERKESMAELTGRLAIEEHHVARRKILRRWVLKTASGDRIPLTLNFQLLSAVKKPGIPDEIVKIVGKWTTSASEPRLKYLTADRIEMVAPTGSGTSDIASGASDIVSGTSDIASGTSDIASVSFDVAPGSSGVGSTANIVASLQDPSSNIGSESESTDMTFSPEVELSPVIATGSIETASHRNVTDAVMIGR